MGGSHIQSAGAAIRTASSPLKGPFALRCWLVSKTISVQLSVLSVVKGSLGLMEIKSSHRDNKTAL